MVFSSISFLYYFLPIVLIAYFIAPKKIKNIVLLVSSLLFYFYGENIYILVMLFSIFSAYMSGIIIENLNKKENEILEKIDTVEKKEIESIDKIETKNLNKKIENQNKVDIEKIRLYKKITLIIEIIISVTLLSLFKYADFIIKNINTLFNTRINLLFLSLPIGISFYTFQTMSYVIDVYNKKILPQKSIIKLALYITFFPQLIAGPIVRYSDIENSLDNRKFNSEEISIGIRKFIIGLSKKVLLANNLALLCETFQNTDEKSIIFYWIYAIANSLYIYLDFSGYSDMAIGLARIFGFKFPENFNYPYISKSVTEFWRRWHISLSNWFKDYVYIPLGGNRKGILKTIRNILIVWTLTGLWHGANWNFIIWGIYFSIILIIEKIFLYDKLQKLPNIIGRIYTLLIVVISFIIFSASSIPEILENLKGLLGFENIEFCNGVTNYYLKSYAVTIIISILASTPVLKFFKIKNEKNVLNKVYVLEPIILGILLIICTGYLVDDSFNPFLYFRF